ncbi:MAG TPA: hypothetical protein EYP82_07765 [Hydrogenothermaceae bacterium]|nr:hypothetical protein [Hydrogenothermaceae bacterium]
MKWRDGYFPSYRRRKILLRRWQRRFSSCHLISGVNYSPINRRALMFVAVLVIVSPLFGVVGSELVGYHEPLDLAAEMLGLEEWSLPEWTPFTDYTVPGLPDTIGYIVAGFIGVGVILAIGVLLARLTAQQK